MRMTPRRVLSFFFISIFSLTAGENCKPGPGPGPSREAGTPTKMSAIVLFAVGDVRASESFAGSKGRKLKPGDIIQGDQTINVGNRSLCDLQIRDAKGAFVIRLNESTRVKLSAVKFPRHKTFEVSIYRGNALFRMNSTGEERLRVVTPTAAAFVRGTSFQVKVAEDGKSKIGVHEGEVMMLPRIPAVQNIPRKVVESSTTLSRITDQLYNWRKMVKAGHETTTDGSYLNGLVQNSPQLTRTLSLPAMRAVRYGSDGKPEQIKQAIRVAKKELDNPATQKKILASFEKTKPNDVLPPARRIDAAKFRREIKQYDELVPLTAKELASDAAARAAIKQRTKKNYEALLQSMARLMKRKVDTLKLIEGETLRGVIIQKGRDYMVLTPDGKRFVREEDLAEIRFPQ